MIPTPEQTLFSTAGRKLSKSFFTFYHILDKIAVNLHFNRI